MRIKIDVFTPTLTKWWCGEPLNGEPRQCLLLCCVKIYSPSLLKRTDGNVVKGDVYWWRKWVDFLRGSACAVITRNSECSPDFGEARGMTCIIGKGQGQDGNGQDLHRILMGRVRGDWKVVPANPKMIEGPAILFDSISVGRNSLNQLFDDTLFWITIIIFVGFWVWTRIGIPDYVADLGSGDIGVTGGFTSFFLVFYVNQSNTRSFYSFTSINQTLVTSAFTTRAWHARAGHLTLQALQWWISQEILRLAWFVTWMPPTWQDTLVYPRRILQTPSLLKWTKASVY
jgi:hypothetical protein